MTIGNERRISRRAALRIAGAGLMLPLLPGCGARYESLPEPWRPGTRLDSLVPATDAYLDITNQNTGEHLALRFAEDGRYDRRAMQRLAWLFRDWRENEDPEMDPRLYWALAAMSDAAKKSGHSGHITLLSGFRTKRTNSMLQRTSGGAASNSYHTRRRAADIRLDGIPMEEFADYAEWLGVGGVGRYSGSNFVHVTLAPYARGTADGRVRFFRLRLRLAPRA